MEQESAPAHDNGHDNADSIIDLARLQRRALHYAARAGACPDTLQQLRDFLDATLTLAVLQLPVEQQQLLLVDDLYKYRMHQMYSRHMTGVEADFALHIRQCPGRHSSSSSEGEDHLGRLQQQHPRVCRRLLARLTGSMQQADPLHPLVREALHEYAGFTPCEALSARLKACGVAPVQWTADANGHATLTATGPVEAASNAETTCMQAVQEALVAGQVAEQSPGEPRLDRTERLANSLGRMAATVAALNALPHSFHVLLMAGRRSTDLLHLLLQNLYFMQHCRGYVGTSSVMAVALLHSCMKQQLHYSRDQRQQVVRRLAGTHAHEMTSMVQQLLAAYDRAAGVACGMEAPVCITQLLAQLLFLHANGDIGPAGATALPDTFTTRAFLAAALAADVPAAFAQDMQATWGWEVPAGSKVFDMFRVWRLDSGSYADAATAVVDAWDARSEQLQLAGRARLPRPVLLHSNLSSIQDIRELLDLPERIRPACLGFGGLGDGFVPFDPPVVHHDFCPGFSSPDPPESSSAPTIACSQPKPRVVQPCSLVMKAVQARLRPTKPTANSANEPDAQAAAVLQPCATKLGDDASLSKAQADPRLPVPAQHQAVAQAQAMAAATAAVTAEQHGAALSQLLEQAYVAVVKAGCLRA